MREPGWLIRLDDMLECARLVTEYTGHLSKEEFVASRLTIDAVLHNLIIIGEAASRIPADVKLRLPQVSWQKVQGMRNRLVHDYFSADLAIVWQTTTEDIPDLLSVLPTLIASETERMRKHDNPGST